jgi:hypothetical protein
LISEAEERFLRSGTAKTAVPPVGMTVSTCGVMRGNPTSVELLDGVTTDSSK